MQSNTIDLQSLDFHKKSFLYVCMNDLYDKHSNNFNSLVLVFPNKRPVVFAKKYLSEIIKTPCFSPKFVTIHDIFIENQEYTIPNELILLSELYGIFIKKTGSSESFEDFYQWGKMLLQDFDDIDKYLIQAKDLFSNLKAIKEISDDFDYLTEEQKALIARFWNISESFTDSSLKQNFITIWNTLFDIYTEFNAILSSKKIAYEGKAIRSVVSNPIEWDNNKTYVFIGFNALNNCEHNLFSHFQKSKKALFYWDYDMYYLTKQSEAGYFITKNLNLYPNELPESFYNSYSKPKQITIIETPNIIAQAKQCESIITAQNNTSNQAIVLADEQILIPLLNSLPNTIPYNISLGYPIKQTSAFDLINTFCSLHQNCKNKSFYIKDILQICSNPILLKLYPKECVELSNSFKNYSSIYISQKSCIAKTTIPSIFELYIEPITYCNSINAFISQCISKLTDSEIEISILYAIYKDIECLKDLIISNNIQISTISFTNAIIKKTIQSKTIAIQGEPLQGIQIMGILETRLLDFENITLLSMQEGTLPKKSVGSSFIPYSIRIGFGMPTIKEQNAMFAFYFYRLIQRASNIQLLYSSQSDDASSEKSRYLLQLLYESPFANTIVKKQISYPLKPSFNPPLVCNKTEDTLAYLEGLKSGTKKLSPTSFYKFIECELKFYFSNIRKLARPEQIKDMPDERDYGKIFHSTMELLYTPYINAHLTKEDFLTILNNNDLIYQAIQSSIKKELQTETEVLSTDLLYKTTETYVKNLLLFDAERTPFSIVEIEKSIDFTLQIANTSIHIGGTIDRMDKTDNSFRIVDYKTGATKNKIDSIEAIFQGSNSKSMNSGVFQILLYSFIENQIQKNITIEPNLLFLRDLHITNQSQIKINETKNSINNYFEVHELFENQFLAAVERLLDTSIPFTQTTKEGMCKYCDFIDFCNKNDTSEENTNEV